MKDADSKASIVDPVLTTVIANRLDGIVREMSNTLLRAARSAVIAVARDFSCAIVTADNRLLASAEGLPAHIFGAHLQARAMCDLHNDLAPGDAFLHNDPYLGNSHPADQTVIAPVFVEGEHLFTVCAKAHQADIGNSIPTTYHATAKDLYEEGAIIFPCVRLQRGYQMQEDIVRMGMRRIRVPEQWHGDLLAAIGSARTGEKRLVELCEKYGAPLIKAFIEEWFDYSERRAMMAIRELPAAAIKVEGWHDPIPPIHDAPIPVRAAIAIDPETAKITVDLTENVDNIAFGLNLTEATSINNALTGVFNCIDPDIPHNAGSIRRIEVKLRDGAVIGRPEFPHSCSLATTNISDKMVSTIQRGFSELGLGYGLAEGANGFGPGAAVVSGSDFRRGGAPYVNQVLVYAGGGPAGPIADGWITYALPVCNGLVYLDSIELDEVKHPMLFKHSRLTPGSGGAGRRRGGPALDLAYGPRADPMTVVFATDNTRTAPRGVHGGENGRLTTNFVIRRDGSEELLPPVVQITLEPGEYVRGMEASGGGYGEPWQREPERVLADVVNGFETVERARQVYATELTGDLFDETVAVDEAATRALREKRAKAMA